MKDNIKDECWSKFCECRPTLSQTYPVQKVFNFIFDYINHNLTSDAEGEVELLHVTRQKVMGLYANAKKIHDLYTSATCINTKESQQIDICKGVMSILDTLYGSKCLPDEEKFSVGDVVVFHPFKTNSFYDAKLIEIKKGEDKPYLVQLGDKKEIWAYPIEVQSIAETYPTEPKPAEPTEDLNPPKSVPLETNRTKESDGSQPVTDSHDLNKPASTCTDDCPSPCPSPGKEVAKMKPIESKVSVYLATKEEDEEFRLLLHKKGFKWKNETSLISLSCWLPYIEDNKIHYVNPNKTVAYYGDKTSETLAFSEFKKQFFEENVNLSQKTADCDKEFYNILKNSFAKDRRLSIAAKMLQALVCAPIISGVDPNPPAEQLAQTAFRLADALIAECEKGGMK